MNLEPQGSEQKADNQSTYSQAQTPNKIDKNSPSSPEEKKPRKTEKFKKWTSNQAKKVYKKVRYRRNISFLIFIVAMSLIICLAVFLDKNYDKLTKSPIEILYLFDIGPFHPDTLRSFRASLWEDIVFFLVIGLLSIFLFTRDPSSYSVNQRLWYVFSGKEQTSQTFTYIEQQVRKLAAYISYGEVSFTIDDYDEERGLFKMTTHFDSKIVNLFSNDEHKDEITAHMFCDEVAPEGQTIGEITEFSISHPSPQGGSEKTFFIGKEKKCFVRTGESPEVKREFPITIAPNSYVDYVYSFWQWCDIQKPFDLSVFRFTEKLDVKIMNTLPKEFDVSLNINYQGGEFREEKSESGRKLATNETYERRNISSIHPLKFVSIKVKIDRAKDTVE